MSDDEDRYLFDQLEELDDNWNPFENNEGSGLNASFDSGMFSNIQFNFGEAINNDREFRLELDEAQLEEANFQILPDTALIESVGKRMRTDQTLRGGPESKLLSLGPPALNTYQPQLLEIMDFNSDIRNRILKKNEPVYTLIFKKSFTRQLGPSRISLEMFLVDFKRLDMQEFFERNMENKAIREVHSASDKWNNQPEKSSHITNNIFEANRIARLERKTNLFLKLADESLKMKQKLTSSRNFELISIKLANRDFDGEFATRLFLDTMIFKTVGHLNPFIRRLFALQSPNKYQKISNVIKGSFELPLFNFGLVKAQGDVLIFRNVSMLDKLLNRFMTEVFRYKRKKPNINGFYRQAAWGFQLDPYGTVYYNVDNEIDDESIKPDGSLKIGFISKRASEAVKRQPGFNKRERNELRSEFFQLDSIGNNLFYCTVFYVVTRIVKHSRLILTSDHEAIQLINPKHIDELDAIKKSLREFLVKYEEEYLGKTITDIELSQLRLSAKLFWLAYKQDSKGVIDETSIEARSVKHQTPEIVQETLKILRTFNPKKPVFKLALSWNRFFVRETSPNAFMGFKDKTIYARVDKHKGEFTCTQITFLRYCWLYFYFKCHYKGISLNKTIKVIVKREISKNFYSKMSFPILQTEKKELIDNFIVIYEKQETLKGMEWFNYMQLELTWINWGLIKIISNPAWETPDKTSQIFFPVNPDHGAPTLMLFSIYYFTNRVTQKICEPLQHVELMHVNSLNTFEVFVSTEIKTLDGYVCTAQKDAKHKAPTSMYERTNIFSPRNYSLKGNIFLKKNKKKKTENLNEEEEEEEKLKEIRVKKTQEVIHLAWDIETYIHDNRDPFLSCYVTYDVVNPNNSLYSKTFSDGFHKGVTVLNPIKQTLESFKLLAMNFQKNLIIWTMNGSKFDLIYMLPYFKNATVYGSSLNVKKLVETFDYITSEGKEIKLSLTFLDISLTLSGSLNTLAKLFLKNETKNEIDIRNFRKDNLLWMQNNRETIKNYCIQDCVLVLKVREKFITEINTHFGFTLIPEIFVSASALAFDTWFKFFYDEDIKKPLRGLLRHQYNDIRKTYYGGLTQVLSSEMKGGYYYDINSSYPNVMQHFTPNLLKSIIINKEKIAEIKAEVISTEDDIDASTVYLFELESFSFGEISFLPWIPIKTTQGNVYVKEFNGIDSISGIYKSNCRFLPDKTEVKAFAWDHTIKNILKYDKDFKFTSLKVYKFYSRNLFQKLVETFYTLRCNTTNPSINVLCKLMLNSVYGKTGQREFPYRKMFGCDETNTKDLQYILKRIHEGFTDGNKRYDQVRFHNVQKLEFKVPEHIKDENENDFSILVDYNINSSVPTHPGALVFIASYITSRARLNLLKMIYKIESELNGKVYYMDTDSIFTDIKLPSEFVGKELGKWKLECEVKDCHFYGSKAYSFINASTGQETKKFKGIPHALLDNLDFKEILTGKLYIDIETTWMRRFGHVENKSTKKKMATTLNRREFDEAGNSKPFINLNEFFSKLY